MKNKKVFALIRAAAAVILAVVQLACTGFAFVYMLDGVQEVSQGSELVSGDYVQADLTYIMDVVGVERTESGKEVAYYAVAPVGDQFAIVRFPADEFEDMTALEADTMDFLEGISSRMNFHMVVKGSTAELSDTVSELLSQWFEDNASWMSQSGVIAAVENYSDYLCPVMIQANRIGSMSYTAALWLSIGALALVIYAMVEIICLTTGVYNVKLEKKNKEKKPARVPETVPAAAETAQAEPAAEEPAAAEPAGDESAGAALESNEITEEKHD
jgi:hypothetical protein